MNILYYDLPLFLNKGEAFKYSLSHLNAIINLCKNTNLDATIIKESSLPTNKFINNIPKIETLNFSLNNLSPIECFIKNNNIDIYHCFHNGFSLSKNFPATCISTIYTTLPLTPLGCLDSSYSKLYLDRLINTFNLSHSIIVPYNFMKNDLCSFFSVDGENISIIPPVINFDLIGMSKPLSLAYVRSKFNILKNYYIYIGDINPRNNLIDTIKLFKHHSTNMDIQLVLSLSFLPKNKKLYLDLISFIDRIGLSSKIIFIDNLTDSDFINLINASLCFINLNPFSELNINSIYALFLNTKILTYQNNSNLEFLENYPIYISDYTCGYDIDLSPNSLHCDTFDKDELFSISSKFHIDSIENKFADIYRKIMKERN